MSNQIQVGKTYKLVDASKDPQLQEVIDEGYITFPDDGLVAITSTEVHPYSGVLVGFSKTEGLLSTDPTWDEKGIIAIAQTSLDLGVFEEVVDG